MIAYRTKTLRKLILFLHYVQLDIMKNGGTIKKAALDSDINRNTVMEVHKAHLTECYTGRYTHKA